MKAEEQTLLNETLVNVFKLTEEQLSTLYNGDGDLTDLKAVIEADTKRVAKFSAEKTQQLNRGIKEGAEKVERAIKGKYDVESDLTGVDLVDFVVTNAMEAAGKDKLKDITKHPDYIRLEASIEKQLKERDREWESKLETKEREFNKAKLFEKVRDKALTRLESRKPILPEDPTKAQVWKDTYLNELRGANYQEADDGTLIVLDGEGNVLKDKHGNIITFDDHEKSISDKYFEYPKGEQRSSPGNKPPAQGGQHGDPRTKAEAMERLKSPDITREDRRKYTNMLNDLKE